MVHAPDHEAGTDTVGLILIDARGWVLLQLRDACGTYPHHWATVGGAVEPGETVETALEREVFEETGYRLWHPVTLGSQGMLLLPDGTSRRAAVFYADYDATQPIHCLEGQEITFVDPLTLDRLQMYPGQRQLITAALEHRRALHLGDKPRGPRQAQ